MGPNPSADDLIAAKQSRMAKEMAALKLQSALTSFQKRIQDATGIALPPNVPFETMTPQQIAETMLDTVSLPPCARRPL